MPADRAPTLGHRDRGGPMRIDVELVRRSA